MAKIQDIANRFTGSLTDDQKDELYQLLKDMKSEELTTIEEHKLYIEMLAALRESLMRGMRLMGEKFLKTLESLLSVGEDGVYSSNLRFLYELIQNVDDCDYDDVANCKLEIKFVYNENPGRIVLTYNEKGFKPENVFAITGIAEASKNISADKVEIGEKGIGFKSVFGIADKVLIQSGMFSFELDKDNFTVPIPHYDNFSPVEGTRLELQMPTSTCENIFIGLAKEYRNKDSLLNKNPILFLNKLTHLKLYFDSWRTIEFDVQRSEPIQRGRLWREAEAKISVNVRFHTSRYEVEPYKDTIHCYRYTMPILYGKQECMERYGEDALFEERRHNIVAVFPIIGDDSPINRGLLYSFLPTQVKINAPLILHVPFKLDGSREFVDPQGENAWFKHTLQKLIEFIRVAYLDFATIVKQDIVRYLPLRKNYLFNKDNDKIKCLCVDGLRGSDICDEKIFFTEEKRFESADNIVSFGKDVLIKEPNDAYLLLNDRHDLFIPPCKVDMKQYGGNVIEDVPAVLFRKTLRDENAMAEILNWLESSKLEIHYDTLLKDNLPVTFSANMLNIVGKHSKLANAIKQMSDFAISANKKPQFHIKDGTPLLDENKREEIKTLAGSTDLKKSFAEYLKRRDFRFFVFHSETDFALVADNGIALPEGQELGAFGKAVEKFDSSKTFSASLQMSQASEELNRADEAMDNSAYLKLLRGIRSSLKRAFGEKAYESYINAIAEAGTNKNRFLSELLQNADDCCYADGVEPEFILKAEDQSLEVSYNETGFTKENVRAITAIGESTKKLMIKGEKDVIGEKGVGFKSVFGVAEQVEIHSNGFDFKLTDKQPTIPDKCTDMKNVVGTKMIFKMKEDVNDSFAVDNILKLCICLHNLRHIVIANHEVKIIDIADRNERVVAIDGMQYGFSKFVYDFNVTDVQALTERNAHNRVIKPEQQIIIYVPKAVYEKKSYFVYSGLPIEIKSNVPMVIDAPFELTTSRENILENRWNNAIRDEMYNAIIAFMKSISSSGLDVLKYVGFKSQGGTSTFGNFESSYLNKFDWPDALKLIPFIPILGSKTLVSLEYNQCVLVPEFISRVAKDTTQFGDGVVDISGKTQYARLLEQIGCRKVTKKEIYNFLEEHVQEYITDAQFHKGLYAYLSGNQGNFAFETIGPNVKKLPIFPIRKSEGTEFVEYSAKIYTHDTKMSDSRHYILDTNVMSLEIADKILPNVDRIRPLDQKVIDAEYRENLETLIENNDNLYTPQEIATCLLKQYETNRPALEKCRNTLRGIIDKIPMLMQDGQFKTGKKFVSGKQRFAGKLISHLIVDEAYADLAQFLGLEDIFGIHKEAFDFKTGNLSDDDIEDIRDLANRDEILKYFVENDLITPAQIQKFHLEFVTIRDEYDDDEDEYEEFPEQPVSNYSRLKNHMREQLQHKNPYIEKQYIMWRPSAPIDKEYVVRMYKSEFQKKCFCQMCGKKYSPRYITRNSIERNPAYAWDQTWLCLCLQCSKDYSLLRNNDDIWLSFIKAIMDADVTVGGTVDVEIHNKSITFTATHLAEVQEIFRNQGWGDKAPKRKPHLGTSEEDEGDDDME